MALWYPTSDLTLTAAKTSIARVIGAETDAVMLERADDALRRAFAHWDNERDWNYALFTESKTIEANIPSFAVVTTYKKTYNIRLTSPIARVLEPIMEREYDLLRPDQVATGTPWGYKMTSVWQATGTPPPDSPGLIVLTPTPDSQVILEHTYFVRHVVPTVAGNFLEVPLRYQHDLIALAKMYFLGDRGSDENLAFWTQIAMQGLQRAKVEDEWLSDNNTGFIPGHVAFRQYYSPNDVLPYLGDW